MSPSSQISYIMDCIIKLKDFLDEYGNNIIADHSDLM